MSPGARPPAPDGRPLRVGVIGTAYGGVSHLPTFAARPEYEVVAVATSRPETARAAAERFGVPRAVVGYSALCADPEVDLVCVATRPRAHPEMVLAALEAGKHVFCEAPLAPTVAEAEVLCRAAQRAGVVAVVGMQSRFSSGLWRLRELVRDGWLGTVQNVHATAFYPTFTRPEAVRGSGWCADAANGASSLRVHGLHTADLIRWMLGEFRQVRGVIATRLPVWSADGEQRAASSADSAVLTGSVAGAPCAVHTSWVARFGSGWRLELHGSDGYLRATAEGHTGHFPVTVTGASVDRAPHEIAGAPPLAGHGHDIGPTAANHALAGLLCRLARRITGAAEPDLPEFADGLAVLRLAAAAEE